MKAAKVEVLIWVLVYGGLFLLGLGLAVKGSDATLGWSIGACGIVITLVGALLVWVRSRMKER